MQKKETILENEDTTVAVRTFISQYEAKNKVTITKTELENNVVKPGDNFCSGILRLKFEYHPNDSDKNLLSNHSVILKVPSLSMNYAEIAQTPIYDNEIFVYEHFLPKLNELWHGERFSPYFHTLTEAKVLIFEDLTAAGYRAHDKRIGLDLAHGRVALTTLARYHAVTVKYLKQVECRGQTLSHSLIEPIQVTASMQNSSNFMLDRLLELTKDTIPESIQQKVKNFKDKLVESSAYHINSDNNGLTVIAHGDFWNTNILFKYAADNEVTAAKMVDWQLCRKTSPLVDIIYFFVNGLQFDVFERHQEELINIYLATLNDTLSELKCDCAYTRALLDHDMQKYKYLFLNLLINATPLAMLEKEILFSKWEAAHVPQRYLTFTSSWLTYLDKNNFI